MKWRKRKKGEKYIINDKKGLVKQGKNLFLFLQQISMSATITMVAVHKPVPTQMVHFSAAVTLGLD